MSLSFAIELARKYQQNAIYFVQEEQLFVILFVGSYKY
ncbi:DUF3293 domain-containing protein [Vibrio taketomensis]|nr:hypothetical protein [Vibrio taketomensis]